MPKFTATSAVSSTSWAGVSSGSLEWNSGPGGRKSPEPGLCLTLVPCIPQPCEEPALNEVKGLTFARFHLFTRFSPATRSSLRKKRRSRDRHGIPLKPLNHAPEFIADGDRLSGLCIQP